MSSVAQNSAKEKGIRLKWLRRIANLDRKSFAEKYHINRETFKGWENGKHGGVTLKQAKLLIDALKKNSSVDCSLEWLMYGVGNGPQIVYTKGFPIDSYGEVLSLCDEDEQKQIRKELDIFMAKHKDALVFMVPDGSMEPHYKMGDIVVGVTLFEKDFQKGVGEICIIKKVAGKMFLRKTEKGAHVNELVFSALNSPSRQKKTALAYDDIICVAPVIWHRRRLKTLFS